jgi:SAM-dependent methyltransferase
MLKPHGTKCICCQSTAVRREWAALSSFFAQRALRTTPRSVPLYFCRQCKTRAFDLDLSAEALSRLYANYRGEDYFQHRHALEPWYTRAVNDGLGDEAAMQQRRKVLTAVLREIGADGHFGAVLDHGGDRGQMLLELDADSKYVHDISGVAPDPGIKTIEAPALSSIAWDVILSCHVLEHLPTPAAYLQDLARLGRAGTLYFFEVPSEAFYSTPLNGWAGLRAWIDFAARLPRLFKILDFLSTGVRARLGVVPPLLFLPLREHLTFFTIQGLVLLLTRHNFTVLSAARRATGHIVVAARLA